MYSNTLFSLEFILLIELLMSLLFGCELMDVCIIHHFCCRRYAGNVIDDEFWMVAKNTLFEFLFNTILVWPDPWSPLPEKQAASCPILSRELSDWLLIKLKGALNCQNSNHACCSSKNFVAECEKSNHSLSLNL